MVLEAVTLMKYWGAPYPEAQLLVHKTVAEEPGQRQTLCMGLTVNVASPASLCAWAIIAASFTPLFNDAYSAPAVAAFVTVMDATYKRPNSATPKASRISRGSATTNSTVADPMRTPIEEPGAVALFFIRYSTGALARRSPAELGLGSKNLNRIG